MARLQPETDGAERQPVMCGQRARATGELVLALVLPLSCAQNVCANDCGLLRCPRIVLLSLAACSVHGELPMHMMCPPAPASPSVRDRSEPTAYARRLRTSWTRLRTSATVSTIVNDLDNFNGGIHINLSLLWKNLVCIRPGAMGNSRRVRTGMQSSRILAIKIVSDASS